MVQGWCAESGSFQSIPTVQLLNNWKQSQCFV